MMDANAISCYIGGSSVPELSSVRRHQQGKAAGAVACVGGGSPR